MQSRNKTARDKKNVSVFVFVWGVGGSRGGKEKGRLRERGTWTKKRWGKAKERGGEGNSERERKRQKKRESNMNTWEWTTQD